MGWQWSHGPEMWIYKPMQPSNQDPNNPLIFSPLWLWFAYSGLEEPPKMNKSQIHDLTGVSFEGFPLRGKGLCLSVSRSPFWWSKVATTLHQNCGQARCHDDSIATRRIACCHRGACCGTAARPMRQPRISTPPKKQCYTSCDVWRYFVRW